MARRELPFRTKGRCDEGNRSRVEAVNGDNAETEQQHCHLHSRNLLGVDEALHVDFAMRRHGRSSRTGPQKANNIQNARASFSLAATDRTMMSPAYECISRRPEVARR